MNVQIPANPRGRVLIVFPEAHANYGSGDLKREDVKVDDLGAVYPPLGPLYVAAALERAGFAVRFADFSVEPYSIANLRRHLEGCQVLGLHTQTHYRESSARIARDARQLAPGLRVLAGGPDVTLFRHLPEGADVAMTGEVERTVADVVAAMLGDGDLHGLPGVIFRDGDRVVRTEELPVEENLGTFLWPARHLVARRDYSLFGAFRGKSTSLITGRGCTGHCRFCARPAYAYFRYRPRPVADVLDEIQSVYQQGYRFLYITDDNLLAERERAMALVQGIAERRIRMHLKIVARVDVADPELYDALAAAGVRFVDFGIESGRQATLDFYRKRATVEQNRRAVELADQRGIFTHAHVILGAPFEDRAAMRDTLDFVKTLPLDTVFFNILGYRRGSLLWQEAREKGLVRDDEEVVLASRERGLGLLDRPELERVHGEAVRQYYLRPSYLRRGLRKLLGLRDPELAWAIAEVAAKAALKVGWRSARRLLRARGQPGFHDRQETLR
jgi:anaerobic magnesium-protoporphyrin IX monomethyl ester cyclase